MNRFQVFFQLQLTPLHPGKERAAQFLLWMDTSVGWCTLTPGRPRLGRAWDQSLKLTYNELISRLAFRFNLRHYTSLIPMLQQTAEHPFAKSRHTVGRCSLQKAFVSTE